MENIFAELNGLSPFSNVLVACRNGEQRTTIIDLLVDLGVNIIGPAEAAGPALFVAAHAPIDLAVIEPRLAGKRSGFLLARRLEEDWGVRSLMIPDAPAVPPNRGAQD